MRRSISFLPVLMLSAVVAVLLANLSSAEAGGGNCQAKLAGNSYDCNLKFSDGPPETDCLVSGRGEFPRILLLPRVLVS
jgi:hypothetical protein